MLTPTLTVTNNNDGTVTVEIADGGVTDTHVIRYAKTTDLEWITLATLLGNTSTTVPIQTGAHWFTSRSYVTAFPITDQLYLAPVMVCISSNEESVMTRILETVVSELQSIATAGSLPGLTSASIARQDDLFTSNLPFDLPGIAVLPGAQEEDRGGTNARDDLGYPVMIVILDSKWAKDPDPESTDIDYLLIRERVRRHFQHRRLAAVIANVPESYTTNVSYEGILDHAKQDGLMRFGSYLTLNFCTREPRGA